MSFCKYLNLITLIFVLMGSIFAASGDLDPTFGKVGFLTKGFTGRDRASTVLVQPDGKFILIGADNYTGAPVTTVVRYNANGTLDTTFDGDGVAQSGLGHAFGAALQTDGKIVVVGTHAETQGVFFAVKRFNTNGSLDTTFAGDGIFTDQTIQQGVAMAVAIQSDGKIVAVGKGIGTNFTFDYATVRLNTDGTPDTTFDGDGKVLTGVVPANAGGLDEGYAVVIQTDGKIVIGGESRYFTLIRYNADGSLDTAFDGDGIVQTDFSIGISNLSRLRGLAIDQSGRIVASGFANDGTNQGFGFARYNSDGSLDTTFDGDGKLIIPNGMLANAVKVQPDGKIVSVGGFVSLLTIRLNDNGSIDTSFGNGGQASVRIFDSGSAVANSLALDSSGNIFAAGYGANGPFDEDFAVAKLTSNGKPSSSFGIFGYITTPLSTESEIPGAASSVKVQPNGDIIVGGNGTRSSDQSLVGLLAQYDANGRINTSFGGTSNGLVGVSVSGATDYELNALELQPDGKILAVGNYEGDSDGGTYLYRFNANGERDTAFGGNNTGYAIVSVFSGGGLGRDVALLPDGKILVAGATVNIFTQVIKPSIIKFNANGSRDTTFGTNGIATTSFSASNDIALSIAVQSDGKILIGGASNFDLGQNGSVAIARFNTNGSLDTSFGSAGKVTTDVGSFIDTAADIQVQADGKIVIGGVGCTDGGCNGGNGFIFRYNSNGTLDSTFDGDGKVFTQPTTPGSSTGIASIAIQSNNKIVGVGTISNPTSGEDALVARYNSNGSPDASFGTNGIVASDINNTEQIAFAVALQSDGKIVSAGSHQVGTRTDFAVWRYLGDETAAPAKAKFDFDGDRKTDVSIFRPAPGQWWYLRSSDSSNRAFTFGISTDKLVPADYTGDGKTDIAFWRESTGEWFILRSENGSFYSFPFGGNGDIPAPADYDGDGKDDAAIFRPSNATWYILNSSGGTRIQQFGISEDKPVVADYDGDGKADLAIFRPSNGQWWINRSSTQTTLVYNFGANTDKTVPADYTGDGKADVAFYRPSSGEWFILRSENASFYSFPFGTSGDVPAPGDYDGDGKTDAAIFRPSNNTWYKLQTTNGFEAITFGINNDVPIPNVFVR